MEVGGRAVEAVIVLYQRHDCSTQVVWLTAKGDFSLRKAAAESDYIRRLEQANIPRGRPNFCS